MLFGRLEVLASLMLVGSLGTTLWQLQQQFVGWATFVIIMTLEPANLFLTVASGMITTGDKDDDEDDAIVGAAAKADDDVLLLLLVGRFGHITQVKDTRSC